MKQFVYILLLYAVLRNSNCTENNKTTYVGSNKLNTNNNNNTHQENSITSTASTLTTRPSQIQIEGGGEIHVDISHHDNLKKNQNVTLISKNSTASINPAVTVGNSTAARQNITNKVIKVSEKSNIITSSTVPSPIVHEISDQAIGDSKVKPRKGVVMPETSVDSTETTKVVKHTTSSTTTTTTTTTTVKPNITTTTFKPRKPTVTFGEDEPDTGKIIPPKVFIGNKVFSPENHTSIHPKTRPYSLDISRRKSNDYVLPIVLAILAVPLLAIILTVIYKRGAEWWHHRHYRRMDFLIDGMYNN